MRSRNILLFGYCYFRLLGLGKVQLRREEFFTWVTYFIIQILSSLESQIYMIKGPIFKFANTTVIWVRLVAHSFQASSPTVTPASLHAQPKKKKKKELN